MNDLPKLTRQLEFLFLKRLANGLRERTIDLVAAKKLIQTFRTIEPFSSVEDAMGKVQQFVITNMYFTPLKEYLDAYFSEEHKDDRIEQMREHIKQGNIDQALEVAKQ